MRDVDDPIEKEGISRARQRVANADLTLWLTEASVGEAPVNGNGSRLIVRTKIDLERFGAERSPIERAQGGAQVFLSARTGVGIPDLLDAIADRAEHQLAGQGPALITLERHRLAFEEALGRLEDFLARRDSAPELVAEDLRLAARALERIAGRIDVEEVLGEIFSRLCIGK